MSDRPKAEGPKASPEGSPSSTRRNGSARRQNQQLSDLILEIVEREIGRGEARRPEDWTKLHAVALGHPAASSLETALEGVIRQCNQEVTSRFGSSGMDLEKIRESVVQLIRVSLLKKLGLFDRPKAAEQKASPAGPPAAPTAKSGSSRSENQQLSDLLLGIMEREIGRGEVRRPEDWTRLHALAAGHPGASDLVTTLEGVVQQCNQEMTSRFGGAGVDFREIRQGVVELIRVSLLRRLGLADKGKIKES